MMIHQALELERVFIFAGIRGVMERQLETVIRFSRERRVNGMHLGKNQAVAHKIADMKTRLDTIRLWVNERAPERSKATHHVGQHADQIIRRRSFSAIESGRGAYLRR